MPATVKDAVQLLAFLAFVVGGGTLVGLLNLPGDWYAGLVKPPFNPPNWLFAPVWTILYVLIAIAGWRTWKREPAGPAMQIWFAQQALNFLWSPVFFSLRAIGGALIVIALLLALILVFIATRRRRDPASAALFVPYAAWVSFATLLNAALFILN